MTAEQLQILLGRVLKMMTLHHEHLKISKTALTHKTIIHISASQGDTRRIIGTNGANYLALAQIVSACGFQLDAIGEPTSDLTGQYPEFKVRSDWPKSELTGLLLAIATAVFPGNRFEVSIRDGQSGFTGIELTLRERHGNLEPISAAISAAISTLFRAIGRSVGRRINFDIIAPAGNDPEQPASADGRYAKEKP